MITLRWPQEVRSLDSLELDSSVRAPSLDKRELQMAKRLVEDMSGSWNPDDYRNDFKDTIMTLVEEKASQGKIATVEPLEGEGEQKSADIIDLTELLKRSLGGRKPAAKKAPAAKKPAPTNTPRKKA